MKTALVALIAAFAFAQLAAADELSNLRGGSPATVLITSVEDADRCLSKCNDTHLGKKSKTKTKDIQKRLNRCYNGCFYDKKNAKTRYARSLGDDLDDVLKVSL